MAELRNLFDWTSSILQISYAPQPHLLIVSIVVWKMATEPDKEHQLVLRLPQVGAAQPLYNSSKLY